jgi:hypothetical protein
MRITKSAKSKIHERITCTYEEENCHRFYLSNFLKLIRINN